MNKKTALLAFCIGIIAIVVYFIQTDKITKVQTKKNENISITTIPSVPAVKPYKESNSIFVPYWDLSQKPDYNPYANLYYFGISADSNGVSTSDQGYLNIKKFSAAVGNKKTYLTLRMLNTDENISILKNKKLQQKIIQQTLEIAQENDFTGVVLDLELGVLPFTDVVNNINAFVADFYLSAKQNDLRFLQTIYGDVFYRKRPFDVEHLAQNSDGIVIMAYDFHKASGEPGPNFPLKGREKFGYDFEQMITQFLTVVPAEKLTVVFGMFGYDWITDLDGYSQGVAKSISTAQIMQKYIYKCDWKNCVFLRDPVAAESKIDYVDSTSSDQLIYHTIWYEDQKSVDQKKLFLKEKRIENIAFWAYGYF